MFAKGFGVCVCDAADQRESEDLSGPVRETPCLNENAN